MAQLDIFYNTPSLSGRALAQQKYKAGSQVMRIIELLEKFERLTPLEISDRLGIHQSSARRGCHVLAKQGILEKLPDTKMERYGVPNHYYRLLITSC